MKKCLTFFRDIFSKINLPLSGIILAAFLLRIFKLGKESLWVDEGFTANLVQFNLSQYVDNVLHTTRNILPPLYFQLLHFWIMLFGNSEFSLRFPSVILGTLSVYLVFILARKIFNQEVGLISAILLAFSLFHLQYSQEARMYEMLSFLSLLSFLQLVKFFENGRNKNLAYLVLIDVALVYTHHYGFFIIVAQGFFFGVIFLFKREYFKENIGKMLAAVAIFFALIVPWLFIFINQLRKVSKDPWLPVPNFLSVLTLFQKFSGSSLLLVTFLSLLLFFVMRYFSNKKNNDNHYFLLLVWLLIPILISFFYSIFLIPIFGDKYLIACSIPFYILIAKAIEVIKIKYLKYGILMLVIVLLLLKINNYYSDINKEQWREAAQYVEKNAAQNDLILFNAGFGLENGFNYYAKRSDLDKKPFPQRSREVNNFVTPADLPELNALAEGIKKIWVIYAHSHDDNEVISTGLTDLGYQYDCKEFIYVNVCLFENVKIK